MCNFERAIALVIGARVVGVSLYFFSGAELSVDVGLPGLRGIQTILKVRAIWLEIMSGGFFGVESGVVFLKFSPEVG